MKIVFLDIDGVLNSTRYLSSSKRGANDVYRHLNPYNLAFLKEIVVQTRASIVLSSSWRELFVGMMPVESAAQNLLTALTHYGLEIVDMTPNMGGDRPSEIRQWLRVHPEVESFVILDDQRYNWDELSINWVKTSPFWGLTNRAAKKAVRVLMRNT